MGMTLRPAFTAFTARALWQGNQTTGKKPDRLAIVDRGLPRLLGIFAIDGLGSITWDPRP
jgi:hypothetical protein